jgi:hypothetical protein
MAKASHISKVTHATVRMYCMGTGDCFIVKFFKGKTETPSYTMMIDCGVWSGSKEHLRPFMLDLKAYVNNKVDLLVITHEHLDHVSVFEACQDLFTTGFEVGTIWMGWSEDDSLSRIKKWKTEHGDKKKALAMAADRIEKAVNDPEFQNSLMEGAYGMQILDSKQNFSSSLKNFADLHLQMAANGTYVGMLEGMRIVKKEIANDNIEYLYPGEIRENIPGLEGLKFYVLGPPEKWSDVETEGGEEGETYTHNTILKGTDAFAASVLSAGTTVELENIVPFDEDYETKDSNTRNSYYDENEDWRKIDDDWLFSSGSLALRINSLTNNLSLALAIEFEDSKRVMLFPGDAEYGSWSSWHKIDWKGVKPEKEGIHFTHDLLRRTVFYKIAHHMSHNGTAQKLGLNMMEDKDLVAMATLNYDAIAKAWRNTMPNREMLQELLVKTKGRVMISKDSDLFYDFHEKEPLPEKIKEAQKKMSAKESKEYFESYKREPNNLYVDFTIKGAAI